VKHRITALTERNRKCGAACGITIAAFLTICRPFPYVSEDMTLARSRVPCEQPGIGSHTPLREVIDAKLLVRDQVAPAPERCENIPYISENG